jgi:hypothetical protein
MEKRTIERVEAEALKVQENMQAALGRQRDSINRFLDYLKETDQLEKFNQWEEARK